MPRSRTLLAVSMAILATLSACSSSTDDPGTSITSSGGAPGAPGGMGASGGTAAAGGVAQTGGRGGTAIAGGAGGGGASAPPAPGACVPVGAVSPSTDAGAGQCGRPGEPPVPGCVNACSPGGPLEDACAPSVADEYGAPCCDAGGCAHDFGGGCGASELVVPDVAFATTPACDSTGAALGVVFATSGSITDVTATERSVAFVVSDARGSVLRRVDKATCQATTVTAGLVDSFALAEDGTLYLQRRDPDTAAQSLEIHTSMGAITPVDVGALVGVANPNVTVLTTSGAVAYVVAEFEPPGDPLGWRRVLIEVPCCGGPPRVLADDLASDGSLPFIESGTARGSTLYVQSSVVVLDVGPMSSVLAVDLDTGAESLLFEESRGMPPAIETGRAYFRGYHSIAAVDLASCAAETPIDRPMAEVTAFTVVGDEVYWAERYSGVDFQRLYRKRSQGEARLVAYATVGVSWIGVDATHVYWLEGEWTDTQQIVRATRGP